MAGKTPPAPRVVTARTGRPRKYATGAERSRAYRARQKAKLTALLAKVQDAPPVPSDESKPRTGQELVAALEAIGAIGMWEDRTDIGDSTAFARALGHAAQQRA